jgi:hypothetical protein
VTWYVLIPFSSDKTFKDRAMDSGLLNVYHIWVDRNVDTEKPSALDNTLELKYLIEMKWERLSSRLKNQEYDECQEKFYEYKDLINHVRITSRSCLQFVGRNLSRKVIDLFIIIISRMKQQIAILLRIKSFINVYNRNLRI